MTAVDLSVQLGPLSLDNPVIAASGTFGFGREYHRAIDLNQLGAITTKAVTIEPTDGNPPPRSIETPAGMLNAIGLQNPGIDAVIEDQLPFLEQFASATIVNIAGEKPAEYVQLARRLSGQADIDAIEINISCPNVAAGGMQFGTDARATEALVSAVREVTDLPLVTKLSPNVSDICRIARAAVNGGTDILSAINTLLGMSIDVAGRRPHLANVTGGLSGPAIRPVAVRMVWQITDELDIPVIGIGGITNAEEAVQFILAGAKAVGVGTANFVNPQATVEIIDGLRQYCRNNSIERLQDLRGDLQSDGE